MIVSSLASIYGRCVCCKARVTTLHLVKALLCEIFKVSDSNVSQDEAFCCNTIFKKQVEEQEMIVESCQDLAIMHGVGCKDKSGEQSTTITAAGGLEKDLQSLSCSGDAGTPEAS